MQELSPVPLYFPAPHAVQVASPAVAVMVPGEQGVHELERAAENSPAGQFSHREDPVPTEYFPAAQSSHSSAPGAPENVPLGHPVHDAAFGPEKSPGSQSRQALAADGPYFPAVQPVQATAPPGETCPDGHGSHESLPVDVFVEPGGHVTQDEAPGVGL